MICEFEEAMSELLSSQIYFLNNYSTKILGTVSVSLSTEAISLSQVGGAGA